MQSSATPKAPEVEIDTIRREVRIVRRATDRKTNVLQRCAFAELGHVERKGLHVRLWDNNNTFLAEVSMGGRTEMTSLVSALRDAGKLS